MSIQPPPSFEDFEKEVDLKNAQKELEKLYNDILAILAMKNPTLHVMASGWKVEFDPDEDVAATNGFVIKIAPRFFGYKKAIQVVILMHEVLHIFFKHPALGTYYVRTHINRNEWELGFAIWNIAADIKVNAILEDIFTVAFPLIKSELMTYDDFDLDKDEVMRMSVIDLFNELFKRPDIRARAASLPRRHRDLIQPTNYHSEEYRKMMEKIEDQINQKYQQMKNIGNMPAGIQREFEKLNKTRVPWHILLRRMLNTVLGNLIITTWRKMNRRLGPELPGHELLGRPNIWALIDTSGSISEQELNLFISEMIGALAHANSVVLVPWDAQVYEDAIITLTSEQDAKRISLRGGGGTVVAPALNYALKRVRANDIVIILTDGYWYDDDKAQTFELLKKLANSCKLLLLLTTGVIPYEKRNFWRKEQVIKIRE